MISGVARFKLFIGSFFIQASWSFKRMQGLGFVAALSPALTEIYTDKGERLKALKRHTVYYNAHPYMASPILGAAVNLEEGASKNEAEQPDGALALKEALMGPYGSIGDGFFWGAIRPVAALVGILATLFLGIWGVVIFLALYNFFHIWMRWRGLGLGLKYGAKVIEKVAALELPMWSIRLRIAGAALLGVISTLLVLNILGAKGVENSPAALLLVELALVVLVVLINHFIIGRLAVQRIIYAVIVPALILGIIIF